MARGKLIDAADLPVPLPATPEEVRARGWRSVPVHAAPAKDGGLRVTNCGHCRQHMRHVVFARTDMRHVWSTGRQGETQYLHAQQCPLVRAGQDEIHLAISCLIIKPLKRKDD